MDPLDSTSSSLTASTSNLIRQCWNSVIYHFKETEEIDGIKLDCNKTLLKKSAESLLYCSDDVDNDYHLSLQLLSWLTTPIIISFLVFIIFVYYCAIKPLNWTMDLSDVGYDFLNENKPRGSRHDKKLLVQQIRKLRQIGDLPPVYPNGWFALAESSEIKKSQVKYVAALGENFAVFRTKDGEIKILDAYCPHLGANMAVGGIVHGNCLECPFHGWKFDGDNGNCVEIPYSTSKVPGSAKVKNWKSCEVNELIFVWYHAENEEPSWHLEQVPQIKSREWWYRGRNEFYINAHIQEIPENGADVSHLNAIHTPSMMSGMDITKYNKSYLNFCKHKWTAKWSASQDPDKKHVGVMNLTHKMMLFDKFTLINMDAKVSQVGPSYVELKLTTSFGTIVILQTITPIEPMLQKLTHRLYCPPYLMLYANLFLLGETVMVARDVMVWNHKKFIKNPLLVKEDQTIQLFRRWYSQFYSENSPKFTFKQDAMDW